MYASDKQLIALLGDQIDPSFKEKLEFPNSAAPENGDQKVVSPRSFEKKFDFLPSYNFSHSNAG